jgi:hypothetical protein
VGKRGGRGIWSKGRACGKIGMFQTAKEGCLTEKGGCPVLAGACCLCQSGRGGLVSPGAADLGT